MSQWLYIEGLLLTMGGQGAEHLAQLHEVQVALEKSTTSALKL